MLEFEEYFSDEFFIIDSDYLDKVSSKLYGFILDGNKIIEHEDFNFEDGNISLEGSYILITVKNNIISIKQDYRGCYELYIYQIQNRFVISNSFIKLIDYLKHSENLTFNKTFSDSFLFANLHSYSVSETLVNEINIIPRNYQILINKTNNTLKFLEIDFKEQTINLDSEEGIHILDSWYEKWINIFRHYMSETNNIQIDLSGGMDSRITAAIWLTANVNLNNIYVKTYGENNNSVYNEDFRIASEIANEFDFKLNNNIVNIEKVPYKELNTVLNISNFAKSGFGKLMKWSFYKYPQKRFIFTGFFGETIRGYPNKTKKEFIDKWGYISKSYGSEFELPTRKIIESSYSKLEEKSVQQMDSYKISEKFYTEITRHHHGKETVEYYLSNTFAFAPSLDPELHKLKLNTSECEDNYLLIALIFQRYCPKLLSFDFEGGREIPKSTITVAKKINQKYPMKKLNKSFINLPKLTNNQNFKSKALFNLKDPDNLLIRVFKSTLFKKEFLKYYSLKAYNKIKFEIDNNGLLKNVYSAITILKIIDDINGNFIFNRNIDNNNFEIWLENFLQNSEDENYVNKESLLKYGTLRIDFNHKGTENNTIEVLYSSDGECDIDFPLWFITKTGKGVVIQSHKGNMDLKIKCINEGVLKINFRGIEFIYQNKKIPIYINLTKVIVNNKILLNKPTLVWHEEYYSFEKQTKNNEEIVIHVEWEVLN